MDHWKDDMEKSLKDSLPRSGRRWRKMRERNGPLKGWYGKVSKRLAATLKGDDGERWERGMDHWKDDMEKSPLKDFRLVSRSGRRRRKMRERNGPLKGWYGKVSKRLAASLRETTAKDERGIDHWKDDMEKSPRCHAQGDDGERWERNGPLKGWYGKVSKRLAATLRETTAKDEREEWTIERMIWKSL